MIKQIVASLIVLIVGEVRAESIIIEGWGEVEILNESCSYSSEKIDQKRQISVGNRTFDFKEMYRPLITSSIKNGKYDFLYVNDSEQTIHGTIYSNLYSFSDLSNEISKALKGKSKEFLLTQVFNPGVNAVIRNSDFIHVETHNTNDTATVLVYQSGNGQDVVKLRISPSIKCNFSHRIDV